MQLQTGERAYLLGGYEELLVILKPGQKPPQDLESFLLDQAEILRRLVREASLEELELADNLLSDLLPGQFCVHLPEVDESQFPHALMFNPAEERGPLHEWKLLAKQELEGHQPLLEEEGAEELAKGLTMESFPRPPPVKSPLDNLSPEERARAEELKEKLLKKLTGELRVGFDTE